MNNLLNQIQTDLVAIRKDLDHGNIEVAKEGVHYLHAYIESQKVSELEPELTAA